LILDVDALYALFVQDSPGHWATYGRVELADERFAVSAFTVAALAERVRERIGAEAVALALGELAGGAWEIAALTPDHLAAIAERVAEDPGLSIEQASAQLLAEERDDELLSTHHG
jgi:hypothetical protein